VWAVASAGLNFGPRHVLEGDAVDFLFLTVFAVFLLLTLALVAGCAALERKK
jgi:hypothetical protein